MSLQDTLRADLKVALKQGDKCRLSIVRILLAECRNEEKARMHALDDDGVIDVLSREARKRKESIEAFRAGNRPDLVAEEEAALAIITPYLPEQMGRDELIVVAREAVTASGATGPKDRGRVMSQLMPKVKGKASGKDVNEVVTELLAEL
ncbi:MAG: GatB/YqeY domain-containing protein [Dehalococcoidia bacterium]|nr:GatB/YqeY domain-containing protein [Dehalococcoidia bacterium]